MEQHRGGEEGREWQVEKHQSAGPGTAGRMLIAVLVGLTLLVGTASVVWVVAMGNVEVLEGRD